MPVLTYGAEAWTMTTSDEATLGVFEQKILRKIFEALHVGNGEYRRRWNDKLYELYDDIDIAARIKIQRLRWLGHVVRMDTNAPALKVFDAVPVSDWRQLARERNDWRALLNLAEIA